MSNPALGQAAAGAVSLERRHAALGWLERYGLFLFLGGADRVRRAGLG